MKLELAKALWLQPKLLLLDEPTNHLDFQSLHWLQNQILQFSQTVVIVSHDVTFLHEVCDEILWIDSQKIQSLPKDKVTPEDLVRMQRKKPIAFKFRVPPGDDVASHGLSLHQVEFSYAGANNGSCKGSQPLKMSVNKNVRISGKSRCVLLGKNGSGKSTFLNLCCGNLEPTSGAVDRTQGLKVGHYSQLSEELDSYPDDAAATYLVKSSPQALGSQLGSTRASRLQQALETRKKIEATESSQESSSAAQKASLKAERTIAVQEKRMLEVARGVLSNFGFEGDLATAVPIRHLSGGQKACLKFAKLSLEPVHILLLDEPTNHLDSEAREALIRAIADFEGGVVAVTHDENLVYRLVHCNWTTSELLLCKNGRIEKLDCLGASCLSALKQELRRAEEEEAASCPTAAATERPGTGRKHVDSIPSEGSNIRVTSTKISSTPPPWLLNRRRRIRGDQLKEADAQSPKQVQDGQVNVELASQLSAEFASSTKLCDTESLPLKSGDAGQPNDKSHQTLSTCMSNNFAGLSNESTGAGHASAFCLVSEDETSSCVSVHHPKCIAQNDLNGDLANAGRHSRSRKDLVNLNKAVPRWLQQVGEGELSLDEVTERIKTSKVAQGLAADHGKNYDEEHLVASVLDRARKHVGRAA